MSYGSLVVMAALLPLGALRAVSRAHDPGQGLDPGHLVLADLTQDEVPQLLGLVAEQQHSPVLADHSQHLLTNMNHQLCLDDGVIT